MPLAKLNGTEVEIAVAPRRVTPRHVLFDLDGTLSLLRDGWQDHMVPLMVEVLAECPRHESVEELERIVIDFVDHLTGKQTIYQMIRLAEEVEKRGGRARAPVDYKREYNRRLSRAIGERLESLRTGHANPDTFLLAGARSLLESLVTTDVTCYLASGTDIEYVLEDAKLLRVDHLFAGGIFGALPNYQDFSKEKVIRKILADFDLHGPELLIIGDGYVEIQNARSVEAVAFGIYSKENNRYHMNADKRARLLRAGAHFLASDLAQGDAVLRYLRQSGED